MSDVSNYKKYPLTHYKNVANDYQGGGDVMRIRESLEMIDKDIYGMEKKNETNDEQLRKVRLIALAGL